MKQKLKYIYRRKSGVYYADFSHENKRIARSLRTKNYEEAVSRFIKLRENMGLPVSHLFDQIKDIKLSQALERASYEHFKHYADPKTPRAHIKKLIQIIGDLPLSKLRARHVNKMRVALLEQGLTKATVNQYMGNLRVILYLARDAWEEIDSFPNIPKYRETGNRLFILSLELEHDVLRWMYVQDTECNPYLKLPWADYADLFIVLMDTGLRLSEALNLARTDVYENQLIVRPETSKGRKVRGVPLSPDVKKVLTRRAEGLCGDERYLFGDITKCGAICRMRKIKKGLQLEHTDLGWHSLRHTCATRLIRAGASLAVVQEWLGHSSICTTLKYVKVLNAMKNDAVVNMSTMFKRCSNL